MRIVRFRAAGLTRWAVLEAPSVVEYTGTPWSHFRRGRRKYAVRQVVPAQSRRVEHEAALAVVTRRPCRHVPAARAREYVLGFTSLNDVTTLDLVERDGDWTRAKAFDTFCPLGGCIATNVDPMSLTLEAWVNGEPRQASPAKELVLPVEELVARGSEVMTLLPGDVAAAGASRGAGPLEAGDRVEIRIEGIGSLRNTVVRP